MVWAMKMAGSFGDYFPDGDYFGWDEKLMDYARNGMSAERRAALKASDSTYSYWIHESFHSEIGVERAHNPPVVSPLLEELPTEFRTVKSYNNLGSLVQLTDRLIAVDEALKEIIETLEPNVHRFWAMSIVMPKGQIYPKTYYGMIIGRFLDSFLPDHSNPDSFDVGKNYFWVSADNKKTYAGLAFSGEVIAKAHLWRERVLGGPDVFLSDELQAKISEAKLRVPKHWMVKVI